ncbi:MAG: hypoxanthine phosphoribosyltransferase [Candidatus Syntropharchaeia archaeon]
MHEKVSPLIPEEEIQKKVKELGKRISKDYSGKDLVVIGILKGSWIFMADLIREITIPVKCDFLKVSSYVGSKSSGKVNIIADIGLSIERKDVLLIEDIVDTGITIKSIRDMLLLRKPSSLKICSLLDKPSRRVVEIHPDYIGFEIPDRFVVGYGLDYNERFRNLRYIGVIGE